MNIEIPFAGTGLDKDSRREIIHPGDSVERRNVLETYGSLGGIKKIRGNEKINGPSHDASITSLRTVGTAIDYQSERIYYLMYGDVSGGTPKNSLLYFDAQGNAIYSVFLDKEWFELDNEVMQDAFFLDGWLYYRGKDKAPSKINISLITNFELNQAWVYGSTYSPGMVVKVTDGRVYSVIATASFVSNVDPRNDPPNWQEVGNGDYCYPYEYDGTISPAPNTKYFSAINIPPTTIPTAIYKSDTSYNSNNVRRNLFQFCYRYKYRYHGYSRTSEVSTVPVPSFDETAYGDIVDSPTTNNLIRVYFDQANIGMVEYVELFARQGSDGVWKLISTIRDGSDYFDFYNDGVYPVIADEEIMKVSDFIPIAVRSQLFLSENTLAYGGCTEGFDAINDINVAFSAAYEVVDIVGVTPSSTKIQTIISDSFYFSDSTNITYASVKTSSYDSSKYSGLSEVVVEITVTKYAGTTEHVYIVESFADPSTKTATDFRDFCITAINNEGLSWLSAGSGSVDAGAWAPLNADDFWVSSGGSNPDDYLDPEVDTSINSGDIKKEKGFKGMAQHPFAIIYFDKHMRRFPPVFNDDMVVNIQHPSHYGLTTYEHRWLVNWSINHTPPAEAKYYQLAYSGNNTVGKFWQYIIASATASGTTYTVLNIQSTLQSVKDVYPNSEIESYTYEAGDRIRILTGPASGGVYGALVGENDLEIKDFDSSTGDIYVEYDSSNYGAGAGSLVEIYRPKSISEDYRFFYGVGKIYEIYEDSGSRYHRGDTQDQTATQPATGTLEDGDVYYIGRAFSVALSGGSLTDKHLVQSESVSDFFDGAFYSLGKINVEDTFGQVYINRIRWSNRYIEGASVNNICTFDGLDSVDIPALWGMINRMVQLGDRLAIYTEHKTFTAGIGKSEISDANGNNVFSRQYRVIGTITPLMQDWGTQHPSSVVSIGNYIYGFDAAAGVVWRHAYNGLTPISGGYGGMDYRMKNHFLTLAGEIANNSSSSVVSGYDPNTELVFLAFAVDSSYSGDSDVIAFNEGKGRWEGFFDIKWPDMFSTINDKFLSFNGGELWLHNSDSVSRCSFYGTQYDARVDFFFNVQPNIPKRLVNIGIKSTNMWTVDEVSSEPDASYPRGMLSEIPAGRFTKEEGVYYSEFLRNKYTTNSTASNVDLYRGEELVSRVFHLVLKDSGSNDNVLFSVFIEYMV